MICVDAHFAIGSTHLVCEDFALAESAPAHQGAEAAFVVVSDGCSSSPETDVGARLLASAMRARLRSEGADALPSDAAKVALAMASWLGLSQEAIDATLLAAWSDGVTLRVLGCGDGVVVAVRHDGGLEWWSHEFDRGAPAYPAYAHAPLRSEAWRALAQSRRIEHGLLPRACDAEGPVIEITHHEAEPDGLLAMALDPAAYRAVGVLSDGARSFVRADGSEVPLAEVLPRLLGFKTYGGRFVARRLRRFLEREAAELGWRHKDDLAVAVLALEGGAS